MTAVRIFPNHFAKKLCCAVKLYDKDLLAGNFPKKENAADLHNSLEEFQQMAIGGINFKDSLIAYYGIPLNGKQKSKLETIHKNTKAWALGHISGVLLENMKKTSNKNFLTSAEMLVGQCGILKDAEKAGSGDLYLIFDGQDKNA